MIVLVRLGRKWNFFLAADLTLPKEALVVYEILLKRHAVKGHQKHTLFSNYANGMLCNTDMMLGNQNE